METFNFWKDAFIYWKKPVIDAEMNNFKYQMNMVKN